tara:strand:- start:167 stop:1633 length:1467 start_codon:yes stop_codon:yes gene_type:complete
MASADEMEREIARRRMAEQQIVDKEAAFQSAIDSGQTTKRFGGNVFTNVLESIAKKLLSPVIEDMERYAEEQNNNRAQLEYQNSRLAPSRYYKSLPDLKQKALLEIMMGYGQGNPPTDEKIKEFREDRRMESPGVFYTEGARQQYGGQITGQFEKPLFIVGDFTQDEIDKTNPTQRQGIDDLGNFLNVIKSGQDYSNYLSPVIANLKDDEGILIRSNDYNSVNTEQPPYMVVTKRDGIVYQREIYPDEYKSFYESYITGYPAGNEQIKIDEISSRSMYPRVRFDKILDTLPESERAKLRQLSYMDLAFGPVGYVVNSPRVQDGSAININDSPANENMPSYFDFDEDEPRYSLGELQEVNPKNEYTFIHELAHAFAEKPRSKSLSNTREFIQVQDNDAKESAKFIGKVDFPDYGLFPTLLGEKGITVYGRDDEPSEDLAERFTLYTLDKMGVPIAYVNGTKDVIRFAEIYPWSAAFFDKYLVGPNARRN